MQGTGLGEDKLFLGMAEIRVFAKSGKIYAAPNLIYHYVKDHSYAPPDPFVEAVLTTSRPPDPQYFEQLESAELNDLWWDTRVVGNIGQTRQGVRYRWVPGVGDVPDKA